MSKVEVWLPKDKKNLLVEKHLSRNVLLLQSRQKVCLIITKLKLIMSFWKPTGQNLT